MVRRLSLAPERGPRPLVRIRGLGRDRPRRVSDAACCRAAGRRQDSRRRPGRVPGFTAVLRGRPLQPERLDRRQLRHVGCCARHLPSLEVRLRDPRPRGSEERPDRGRRLAAEGRRRPGRHASRSRPLPPGAGASTGASRTTDGSASISAMETISARRLPCSATEGSSSEAWRPSGTGRRTISWSSDYAPTASSTARFLATV